MKKLFNSILISLLLIITFNACNEKELQDTTPLVENVEILQEARLVDDILLPIGTKVITKPDEGLDFELPTGFKFVTLNARKGVELLAYGSYTCTCTKEGGSCTVFYNKTLGYGCLQSTCDGTCEGKAGGNEQFLGIIDERNNEIISTLEPPTGNLTESGYHIFFEQIAYEKIKEQYDFIYAGLDIDNPEELLNQNESNVEHIQVQYLGIQFSLIVPNFDEHKDDQIIDFRSGTEITCTGATNCTCKKGKKCVLGNCVYYCSGCKSCTITVEEE